jgi:hypothetical protein
VDPYHNVTAGIAKQEIEARRATQVDRVSSPLQPMPEPEMRQKPRSRDGALGDEHDRAGVQVPIFSTATGENLGVLRPCRFESRPADALALFFGLSLIAIS